jgi:adhesin/invasin
MAISQLLNSLIFGATLSIAVLFTAGTATSSHSSLVASPNTIVADGVATMSITFAARDAYNNPAKNAFVSLTATGTSNVFGTASGPTDANGQFTTTLSSSVAQTKTVTATFGSNDTVSCAVSFVAGPASAAGSSFVVNPNTAVANNSATLSAVLILRDAQSNPIAGAPPNFKASGASTTLDCSGETSAAGQATATYKTSMAQNENAVVTAGGITLTAPMAFTPGPAFVATSSLVVSPNSTIATTATHSLQCSLCAMRKAILLSARSQAF